MARDSRWSGSRNSGHLPRARIVEPRRPLRSEENLEDVQVIQVRLPAGRASQLRTLADSYGTLATAMATDWVLQCLDEEDPTGDLMPIPASVSPTGELLASVTRLPVRACLTDYPSVPVPAAAERTGAQPAT